MCSIIKVVQSKEARKIPTAVAKTGDRLRFLYLFSGPSNFSGSLRDELEKLDATCTCVDIAIDKNLNISDDLVWEPIAEDLRRGLYHGGIWSPPCGTFSVSRRRDANEKTGPLPLRSETAPGIYGLKTNTPDETAQVREHTLLALRAVEAAQILLDLPSPSGSPWPWTLETPARHAGSPSVHKLPEVMKLATDPRVEIVHRVQCHAGARTAKPTELLGTMHLPDTAEKCEHTFKAWRIPWSGQKLWQPHPPLRGTQWAIPAAE